MTLSSHNPGLRFTWLTTAEQLDALGAEWERLLERSPDANTFLSPAWLLTWWRAYAPDARLHAIAARRAAELVGLAPMMSVRERCHGVPLECLRFLGDGTFESDHQGFVTVAEDARQLQHALLEQLRQLPWHKAVLANVPESSLLAATIRDWCAQNRYLVEETSMPSPRRRIPESYDALLASLPSRFRTAIRSTRRKLEAAHSVEFGLHDDPAEFDAALQALFDNHESRWRAKGQGGVFRNPRRREFYRTLTRRLHDDGALRFFYLKLDGRIVAQEYCFAHGRTVYLLQEGFDFALAASNVGNALRSHVFQHLIDHGYDTYDFLAGTSRHKRNWSNDEPADITFRIARRSLRGRWAHFAPRAVARAKESLRPLRDRLRGTPPATDPVESPP